MTPSGYSDIFAISIHRHGLFIFESTFRISVFLGFSEKMAILGVGRFKWILCCPLFIYFFSFFFFFFFFFFFWGGGGLFNVKFKLFFIVFFCNFKYLFEKVKISLMGGGGIARHTRYFKVVQSKV